MKFALRMFFGFAVIWLIFFTRFRALRWYPALMAAVFLAAFALSLFRTPLAEVFARRAGERLDETGVRYCRKVTIVWTVFLALHLAVTVGTVFLSREAWAIYNGAIAYVLLGLMFGGEYLVRRRIRRG